VRIPLDANSRSIVHCCNDLLDQSSLDLIVSFLSPRFLTPHPFRPSLSLQTITSVDPLLHVAMVHKPGSSISLYASPTLAPSSHLQRRRRNSSAGKRAGVDGNLQRVDYR
jgi:hypothetical protein